MRFVSQSHRPVPPRPAGEEASLAPSSLQAQAMSRDRPALETLLRLRQDTAMPLYQQLHEQLAALIAEGALPAGTVLPAERQLADDLGLSRATVQRAYNALRQDAMIQPQGRRGSVVLGPRLRPGMDRLKGFTEEMRLLGKVPSARILEHAVETDPGVAAIFGVPEATRFLKLVRVRCGDGIPLSREAAWYNLAAAPGLEGADPAGSVYAALAETCGVPLLYADQSVEATMPSPEECAIFGFDEPVPCLLLKRSSYSHGEVMVEYVEGLFRGDTYSYRLRLSV